MSEELFIETDERSEYDLLFTEGDEGKRIDAAIAERLPQISRSRAQYLIEEGFITLNGGASTPLKSRRIKPGDVVHITDPVSVALRAEPEDIALTVVYEDDDLMVIEKPKGLVVHPAPGNETGTLVNALLYRAREDNRKPPLTDGADQHSLRPGIVHRIDKNTSGLLVTAKTAFAHVELARQFSEHSIEREYAAIAVGRFKDDEGVINVPTGRDPADRKKQRALDVRRDGSLAAIHAADGELPHGFRRAVTRWRVEELIGDYALLALRLETGRTHQIRVHLAHIGRPVLGDDLYGPARMVESNRRKGESQYLHARTLGFAHPRTGEYMEFTSLLPEHFEKKLETLRKAVRA
ncbi:MAG: RluA family pseudouridine synthase [Clostridiales Family XIII bacterium]|jgi:23S rRNA pseudouridine1911/1915/1917 synthase|nr:RluA family pseudouridine synthase [Clostridiales Family XIII bacterium]